MLYCNQQMLIRQFLVYWPKMNSVFHSIFTKIVAITFKSLPAPRKSVAFKVFLQRPTHPQNIQNEDLPPLSSVQDAVTGYPMGLGALVQWVLTPRSARRTGGCDFSAWARGGGTGAEWDRIKETPGVGFVSFLENCAVLLMVLVTADTPPRGPSRNGFGHGAQGRAPISRRYSYNTWFSVTLCWHGLLLFDCGISADPGAILICELTCAKLSRVSFVLYVDMRSTARTRGT